MKRVLLPAVLALGILVACKKSGGSGSSNNTSYHLTGHIDGTAQNFNYTLQASRKTTGAVTIFSVTGYTGAPTSGGTGLGLAWTNTSVGPVFGLGDWYDTSHAYSIGGVYLIDSTTDYGAGTNFFFAGNQGKTFNHLKLNITAYDSSTVTGTFSGDFFENGLFANPKKTIYGDFYARWK